MPLPQEPHKIQGVSSAGSSARVAAVTSAVPAGPSASERLVNDLILKAFRLGASDVHLEPNPDHLLVRVRIDGVLAPLEKVPADQMKQAMNCLKIMSHLDTGESRTAVDGRFNFARYDPLVKELDVRATFLPTFFGEKAVLRLVDHSKLKLSLEELGFTPEAGRLYQTVVSRQSGIVLHVGPQGSGKTTTAYAAIRNVPRPQSSLVTVEEMIEYVIPGVTQVQLNPEGGLTYKTAVQGVLRQDPDVILIGEIKDAETARTAIEAAMTGRLVLSTLHATGAPSAVARLVELGFPRPHVAHSLAGIVSQRLVRRLCPDCRERTSPSTLIRSALMLPVSAQAIYRARSCRKCGTKGYRGRVALYEITAFSDRMREAVASGAAVTQLDAIALEEGTVPLLRDAVEKILRGDTTVEEVLRTLLGVAVEDVSAITEPGDMVNFLKTVRDQFMVAPGAPARAPSSGAIPLPPKAVAAPQPRPTQSFPAAMLDEPRSPSGRYSSIPAAMLEEPRPPSGRYKVPDDMYRAAAAAAQPPAAPPAPLATGSFGAPARPNEELLRSLMSSLPPEVLANLVRVASSTQSQAPPPPPPPAPAPRPATATLSPDLVRQLQELQKRLQRSDSGPQPPRTHTGD
jgi:type II secretory ATPase GspE/PulE/Tfp pilus assembly ATPase PilB-like protein